MDNMVPDPSPPNPLSIEEIQAQIDHLEKSHKQKGFPLSGRIIHLCHHLPVEITRVLSPPPESQTGRDSPSAASDGFLSPSLYSGSNFAGGVLPPQRKEEFKEPHSTTVVASDSNWKLASRRGHTAMISGIRSLSSTHEQVIVAWTGDVLQEYAKKGSKNSKRQPPPPHAPAPIRPVPRRLATAGTAPGRETPAQPDVEGNDFDTHTPEVEEVRPLLTNDQPSVYIPELTEEEQRGLERELEKFSVHETQKDKTSGKLSYAPVYVPRATAKDHYEGYCKTSKSDISVNQRNPVHCGAEHVTIFSTLASLPLPLVARLSGFPPRPRPNMDCIPRDQPLVCQASCRNLPTR